MIKNDKEKIKEYIKTNFCFDLESNQCYINGELIGYYKETKFYMHINNLFSLYEIYKYIFPLEEYLIIVHETTLSKKHIYSIRALECDKKYKLTIKKFKKFNNIEQLLQEFIKIFYKIHKKSIKFKKCIKKNKNYLNNLKKDVNVINYIGCE